MIEKLFGYDLVSVCELNKVVNVVFLEEVVFCIDYYLGKEMV